jgi:hypothetical protein
MFIKFYTVLCTSIQTFTVLNTTSLIIGRVKYIKCTEKTMGPMKDKDPEGMSDGQKSNYIPISVMNFDDVP